MKVLKNHEFARAAGFARKHDWPTLLDGQTRQLDLDDIGDAKPQTFGSLFRLQADKRDLAPSIQTVKDEDGNVTGLIVRALPMTEEQVTARDERRAALAATKAAEVDEEEETESEEEQEASGEETPAPKKGGKGKGKGKK